MTQTLQEKIADIIVDYEKPESAAKAILALIATEREALRKSLHDMVLEDTMTCDCTDRLQEDVDRLFADTSTL